MGETAKAASLEDTALDALRRGWGEAYEISYGDGQWTAARRDDPRLKVEARNPDELWAGIYRDYSERPVPRDLPARGGMMGAFTTAGLGVVPGAGGDVDHVVRREAWERAHPGATAGPGAQGQPGYTARWPDGSAAGSACGSLGLLMDRLDRVEDEGRCPVHGEPG